MAAGKKIAISVKDVYKSFKIPHEKNSSLKSAALNIFRKNSYTQHDAAQGVSFEVAEGEFFGIIGKNGCGKSTMLKMLAGIYLPDKGKISVNGRLSPFLELGVGFNPELSARDNVYLNGAILGLTRNEIDEKFDEIISFAELEEFVDQKLKNFSSGMQVRLAFSVAIQAHSEVLLIDEVLAVGDTNFQAKCFEVFRRLKKEGRTIVFVSHGMSNIREFCDRVIMLKDGKILKEGLPEDVIFEYEKANSLTTSAGLAENEIGNKKVVIEKVSVTPKNGLIATGENLTIISKYINSNGVTQAHFAVGIHRIEGGYMMGVDTKIDGREPFALNKKGEVVLQLSDLPLLDGEYVINVSCFEDDISVPYHFVKDICRFKVLNKGEKARLRGYINVDHAWSSK